MLKTENQTHTKNALISLTFNFHTLETDLERQHLRMIR